MKIFIKIIIFFFIIFFSNISNILANEKIKIGLLVPLTGKNNEIGKSIIKSIRLAINKIDNPLIEIIPRDTKSNPDITLKNAKALHKMGVKIVIGPVFNKNLIHLKEINDMIFLSLTNKIINNSNNIISAGINSTSQFNTISKFQKINNLKKTIILIPKENYKEEIEEGIKHSKIQSKRIYYYEIIFFIILSYIHIFFIKYKFNIVCVIVIIYNNHCRVIKFMFYCKHIISAY